MKDKKLRVLMVLVPLAVISLIYGVITPAKSGATKVPHPAAAKGAASSGIPAAAFSERQPKKGSHSLWGRNPFLRPQVSSQGISMKGLVLHGILWEEGSPRAVINEKIVKVGDRIRDYEVVKIEKDRVTLTDGSTAFDLRLGRKK